MPCGQTQHSIEIIWLERPVAELAEDAIIEEVFFGNVIHSEYGLRRSLGLPQIDDYGQQNHAAAIVMQSWTTGS